MVDAGERRSDQAKPPEKGNGVRGATTLRTQQAVARYGKAARHPLCLAALDLLRLDEELFKWMEEIELSEELVKRTERNEKEANQISALLRKSRNHSLKARQRYQAAVRVRSIWQEMRPVPLARFKREYERVVRAGDAKGRRALQRLRKRWMADEAALKAGGHRKLETLNMLRKRVIEAKGAIDGVSGRYLEAVRGGDRPLSNEDWQGRLTAKQIHSHIVATRGVRVAGDKDAKEIRRLARKLKIRLAEDQRGRKRKPYMAEHEPKRPLGRPRIKPGVSFTGDVEAIQGREVAAARGKIPVRHG